MSEQNEHHPSCSPHDRDLVWHCSQCGLNESAADIEATLDQPKPATGDQIICPHCGWEFWCEQLAAEVANSNALELANEGKRQQLIQFQATMKEMVAMAYRRIHEDDGSVDTLPNHLQAMVDEALAAKGK